MGSRIKSCGNRNLRVFEPQFRKNGRRNPGFTKTTCRSYGTDVGIYPVLFLPLQIQRTCQVSKTCQVR